ncbi:hypothetical protein [Hymenobacter sp. BRD67]|uniref:hypothetical protein n=1 Tax=Hymenobacter sp. BRD67 TaxID=2675877 RepID=UPI0015667A5B|nr:hypothetical protein [Hymenobacter sp. BRD67]QKG52234.1 hypothetical protein GKZ67_05920 [Hymenobacter sp. BRD67]
MKYVILLVILLAGFPGISQRITVAGQQYMDTTSISNAACSKALVAHYYSVEGKYPRSSDTLLREAQAFLKLQKQQYAGTGYVTFRFIINCAGHRLPRTQVLQTDASYQQTVFQPELVEALYAFLQTLTEWQVAKSPGSVNYIAYLTFKMKNGEVVAMVP